MTMAGNRPTKYPDEGIAAWAWEDALNVALHLGHEVGGDTVGLAFVDAAIGLAFNPPDDDVAAESILADAVERAAQFIESLPCTCGAAPPDEYGDRMPCDRCQAIGRDHDVPIDR